MVNSPGQVGSDDTQSDVYRTWSPFFDLISLLKRTLDVKLNDVYLKVPEFRVKCG
jgi:hypothetical protein